MVYAWYGHLKDMDQTLWKVILTSWVIALFEYMFMIPANRIGITQFNVFQLKMIQEVIHLTIFTLFAIYFLKEKFSWNYLIGFGLLLFACYFIFRKPIY